MRETTDHEAAALDRLSPDTHPARDATSFRRIVAALKGIDDAHDELRASVAAAREAGDSWTVIGAALGVSRQAAQERFGGQAGPTPAQRDGLSENR
ncbi:MAG: hypothetical protein FWE15_20985 [Actinomycetia bacterium]|nr:hypothetical protein [Actinomycetes bacterium]